MRINEESMEERKEQRKFSTIDNERNDLKTIISEDDGYIYYLSIIDYFQEYNFQKKLEHLFKTHHLPAKKARQISAIPPKPYADRFYRFMLNTLLNIK